jgi:GNAT superfamily N-acetyltransferase
MIKEITSDSSDLSKALALVWQTFLLFEAPDYSEQGIHEFQGFIEIAAMKKRLETNRLLIWGFYENAELAGVLAVRDSNHISLLFVAEKHQHKGIARSLHAIAADYCVTNGSKEITVNSSPYAVPVYRKLGFTTAANEQEVNGIRFTPMIQKLV